MKPEKLVMENFGPFSGRAELDFSRLEDIFLITGKTGSGKTTIFDAVCFALYGKVPGSRGDHPLRLRSDYAPEEGDCFVSLEFSLGDKRYLAERRPKQERKKKRGEGTIQVEETLVLYEISGGVKTSLISKKSEGDAKLKSLIGLEAEEFFRIVLLPQGEFAEFLKENTNERQKVLGKLFPVEKAVRVKELARKKAAEAEAEVNGAARILDDIARRVSPGTFEKIHAEAAAVLEEAGQKALGLEKEEVLLGQILGLKRNEKDIERRLEESLESQKETLLGEILINEKNAALSRSRAARPLEKFLRSLETAGLAAKTAAGALAAADEEKNAAEKAASEAEEANLETPALEKEILLLREKRPALAEMLEEEKKLKISEDELNQQKALTEKLSGKIKLLLDELKKQEVIIDETEILAAKQSALEGELELSKTIKDIFLEFRKYRERVDELEREHLRAEEEIKELARGTEENEKHIPVLKAEINRLREEKARSEQADMAAHLSALLEKGKPCPVCGSTEHPCPAAGTEVPFGFDERIKVQEASLLEAEKKLAGANTALNEKKKEILKNRDTFGLLEKEILVEKQNAFSALPADYPANAEAPEYLKSGAPLPSKETIGRIIKTEAERLNGILEHLKNSKDAAGRIKELYRRRTEIQSEMGEDEKRLAGAEEQKKNLEQRIETVKERHLNLLKSAAPGSITAESAAGNTPFAANGQSPAAGALAALDSLISEKENIALARREKKEKAELRLSAARAAREEAARNNNGCAARLKDAEAQLKKALLSTDFSRPEEAENVLLEPDAEETLEKEIRQWRENRARLETQIAEQKNQMEAIHAGLSKIIPAGKGNVPSAEEAEGRLESLKAGRAAAEEEKNRAFAALTNLEKDHEALEAAQKRHDELDAEARKLRALSDDLAGKNPGKLPFDSWLLGNYLAEAAAYATARLEKMSESRYSLLLDTGRQQSRGYAGLELQVFDAHTGKTRPCATLSGGESFMASISLALGLADSIQNRSGGVKLDAVFIDEGFGTLDETSLDKALVILDELRERRMVGLISHVGELRSRIPCRVELVKTAAGSKIEAGL